MSVEQTLTASLPKEEEGGEEVEVPIVEQSSHSSNNDGIDAGEEEHDEEEEEEKREFLSLWGPAYATNVQYWKGIFFSSVPQGCLLALIALAFFNFYAALGQATWLSHEYHEALKHIPEDSPLAVTDTHDASQETEEHAEGEDPIHLFRLGNGEWFYVGMVAGAGLAVGLVKICWTLIMPERHAFPRKVPGFLEDIRGLHAHDIYLPLPMLICSGLSIGLGASVGPEAGMGATGTAMGTFLSKRWRIGKFQAVAYKKDDGNSAQEETDQSEEETAPSYHLTKLLPDFSNDEKFMVMDGIAGAFGALFPSQYLSPMLLFELGNHWGDESTISVTETLARTGISASAAYIVFTSIQNFTLLSQLKLPAAAYDVLPTINVVHMFEAMVLGVICGFVGLAGLLILVFGQVLGNKLHDLLDLLGEKIGLAKRRVSLGLLLTPMFGGVVVGLLCVLCPLCLSDGADQLGSVVTLGKALGAGTITVNALVKFLCLAFSNGFGFVGGPIFPFVFVGACVGTVATLIIPGIPVLVAVPSCIVAVPCAFIPAIFTFTTLASMMLALGGAATSPVFVACACSYTTICGFGVLHRLFDGAQQARKAKKKAAAAANKSTATSDDPQLKDEEEGDAKETSQVKNASTTSAAKDKSSKYPSHRVSF